MWKNECNKFKPNIFNKQKCANCYRIREQHSQEALEVNRATRIVSKCGYLFVAPNWDFSNPVYRTKRWQRRWFILYDDGELTYSVDDHVDTVPQAVINLNSVFEITEADAITGNDNSIAVVASDGIHFVKGACLEESRLWLDILRLFPQAAGQTRQVVGNGGRAKRSATFPGLRSVPAAAPPPPQPTSGGLAAMARRQQQDQLPPTPPTTSPPQSSPENSPSLKAKKYSLTVMTPPLTPPTLAPSTSVSGCHRRYERSKTTADFSPSWKSAEVTKSAGSCGGGGGSPYSVIGQRINSSLKAGSSQNYSFYARRHGGGGGGGGIGLQRAQSSTSLPPSGTTGSFASVRLHGGKEEEEEALPDPPTERRGAPDGCGLDPAANETSSKKGWLMKQGSTKEWHKYWFVLQDVALLYYRDPKAEGKGFLDGIVDLSLVQRIGKQDLPRHFGFYVRTYEGKTIVFSAITDGIRKNWIASLQKAANVGPSCPAAVASSSDGFQAKRKCSRVSERPIGSVGAATAAARIVRAPRPSASGTAGRDEQRRTSSEESDDDDDGTSDSDESKEKPGPGAERIVTVVDSPKADVETPNPPFERTTRSNELLPKQQRSMAEPTRQPELASGSGSSVTEPSATTRDESQQKKVLGKAKDVVVKRASEIASLKNELNGKQLQIQRSLSSLREEKEENAELRKKVEELNFALKSVKDELRTAEDAAEKEAEKANELRHDFECNLGKLETEVDKWKLLHESLYLQHNRESRSWKEKLLGLERSGEANEASRSEELRKRDALIEDLSEQLKESDDRIREMSVDLESVKAKNAADFAANNRETISKFVVSMEEKFEASLKSEKKQLERTFKERLREHEMYERQQRIVTAGVNATASSFGNWNSVRESGGEKSEETEKPKKVRRPSLVKINSMTDLLSLRVPSMEAIESMEREDIREKFLMLLDHFYASVDEIRRLRVKLRESQDASDTIEIDKMRFEESFKRTIVMQEQQEKLMSRRIEDLTEKLHNSEKAYRQLKDSRKHSKRKDSNLSLTPSS